MIQKRMICKLAIGFMIAFFVTTTTYASGTKEVLMGIDITNKTIELHVASGGCTTEKDFKFEIIKGANETYTVTIWRVTPDDCKGRFPDGVRLSFDREEIGLDGLIEFTITNKIGNTSQNR